MPTPLTDADKVLRNDTGKDIVTALSKMSTLNTKQITNTPIASFTDGADNIPVKSLISEIVAVESGNGQPKSPDNPYTISGFDSGIITRCGVNLWNEEWELGTLNVNDGSEVASTANIRNKGYILAKPSTNYYFSRNNVAGNIFEYDENHNFIRLQGSPNVFTTSANCHYLRFYMGSGYGTTYNNDISINYHSTDTQYHAYSGNTYTFTFGQTVYGGHFDNKGNLVVTHGYIASYNGETINEPWISSMDNYVPNTSPSTGAQVVYPLTTPTTLSITSQDIPTLLGENNIFSNCGDINTLVYYPQGQDAVVSLNSIANGVLGIADVLTEGLDNIAESVVPRAATEIPIQSGSATNTKDYIDTKQDKYWKKLSSAFELTGNATGTWSFTDDLSTSKYTDILFTISLVSYDSGVRNSMMLSRLGFEAYGVFYDYTIGSDRMYFQLSKATNNSFTISGTNLGGISSRVFVTAYYR